MGIPKFARFIITRYPLILKKIREEGDIPEIDNLYLDINGIIHNVSHGNDIITACMNFSSEKIYSDVCITIDKILKLIKPKKLLMISADGVAPRAKMNQQRSRRFRKNVNLTNEEIEILKEKGLNINNQFNSDSISAGTKFMFNLSIYMNKYIEEKKKNDILWKNINILFTGSDVPGEGEHKILEYIRNYKSSKDYIKNTKHCIYGLDADLIMLSLITHEPNFIILREDTFIKKRKEKLIKKYGDDVNNNKNEKDNLYEIILVSVLREYLELEFLEVKPKIKFNFNIERIIDDFVFFCFFIGNDFLPNLNSLDIETGALDYIFAFYKDCLPDLDDYITFHGKINFERAKKIFALLSKQELHSLDVLLDKIKETCKENRIKKNEMLLDKMYKLKKEKLNIKKEKLFNELSKKPIDEIKKFKSERKKKKFESLKNAFKKKMEIIDCKTGKTFEEQLDDYLTKKNDENMKKMKIITNTLVSLFDSDDEGKNSNINNEQKPKIINENSTIEEIFDEAEKYYKYIKEENYYSDFNVNDINDSDVSTIDEKELEIEVKKEEEKNEINQLNYEEKSEDLNQQFFETLVKYYVNDINKAKEFYYKEKLHFDITTEEGKKEKEKMFNKYLEGLQWVLYYYYRGIKSWKWYYPYHYAPMISDFDSITYNNDLDNIFLNDNTSPFNPFQSLLFILPKSSFNLLPKCYENILNEIPELYPETFSIDYNGKRTSWESIVILPFLDEKLIIDLEKKYRNLNPDEEIYDKWGESYYYSSNGNKEVYKFYRDINTLLKSNYEFKKIDYSFPTLKSVQFDFSVDYQKIYYGKNFKKSKRILIHPQIQLANFNKELIDKYLHWKNLFVNYPFKSFAKIIGFVYNKTYYYLFKDSLYIDPNFKFFLDLPEKIYNDYYKKGIALMKPDLLCNVVLFKGFSKQNGKKIRIYDEQNSMYIPFETTSFNWITNEYSLYKDHFFKIDSEKVNSGEQKQKFIKGSKKVVEVEVTDDNFKMLILKPNKSDGNENKNNFETNKILSKKVVINKKFKGWPEGIEIDDNSNKISFQQSNINVSEYRENRLFQNENIQYHQLYYYSGQDCQNDLIKNNSNIIFKKI